MTPYEIEKFGDLDEQTVKDLEAILDRIPANWGKWLRFSKGWIPLVIQLDKDISALVPDYELHQAKEKFAGLRYYMGFPQPERPACCQAFSKEYPLSRASAREYVEMRAAKFEEHKLLPEHIEAQVIWDAAYEAVRTRYDACQEEINRLIDEAEAKSYVTCEECSAPATMHTIRVYNYTTLCPECAATLGATEVTEDKD